MPLPIIYSNSQQESTNSMIHVTVVARPLHDTHSRSLPTMNTIKAPRHNLRPSCIPFWVLQLLHVLYVVDNYTVNYRIAGNFRGVQFSRIGHSESFRGLIFRGRSRPKAHPYRHVKKFVGLIYADTPRSMKTAKINTLEDFPLYGILCV